MDLCKRLREHHGDLSVFPTGMMEAAYGVGLLNMLAGEAEGRVLYQMVLLLVKAVQIQKVLGHSHPWPGLGLRLQAQAFQEKPLDGLRQAGLEDRRSGRRRGGRQGGRGGGHAAMVNVAGVSALATRRGLR